jgi:hypothetical protein
MVSDVGSNGDKGTHKNAASKDVASKRRTRKRVARPRSYTAEQLLWALFELTFHWMRHIRVLEARRPFPRAEHQRVVRVSRGLRVLMHSALEGAAPSELELLDKAARKVLARQIESASQLRSRRLGVTGDDLVLPDAYESPTYTPIYDVIDGQAGESYGRAELGKTLVRWLEYSWAGDRGRRRNTAAPTPRDWAIFFADDQSPGAFVPMSPPPLRALETFFLEHGKSGKGVSVDSLEARFARVLEERRLDSSEALHEVARKFVVEACLAAGLTRHQARALFEADEKAQRRQDRRGTKARLSRAT